MPRVSVVVRNVAKRFAVDGLIIAAALGTILLAMVLLAAGPIYSDASARSALRRTFVDAPTDESTAAITTRLQPDRYESADDITTTVIGETFDFIRFDVERTVESETFAISGAETSKARLAVFRSIQGIEQHTSMVAGQRPEVGNGDPEVALSERTAAALEVDVGDVIELTTRRADDPISVSVVGIVSIDDPTDRFWFDDELAIAGLTESASFLTYGPFIVPLDTMVRDLPTTLKATWRVIPAIDDLRVSDAAPLRAAFSGLERNLTTGLNEDVSGAASQVSEIEVEVGTGPVRLLSGTERSLTVTQSSVIGLLLQLGLLAGYALALTAGLLAGTRRGETALIVARGAGARDLLAVALIEAVLLTAPSVAAAPWIAARLLRLLNHVGPLANIGLAIDPVIVGDAYLAAGAAALVAIPVLVWPALRSARDIESASPRRRAASVSAAQRTGLDLSLMALAVAAFWQLSELGGERAGRIRGRFDVDPLVIVAPALGMLAGTVLALRVIPLLARLAERSIAHRSSILPALAAWQVARRPLRHGRAALLLIMATGLGIFGAAYSATWLRSQADQAAHQVGADIRVTPNLRTNDSIGDMHLGGAHEGVDGIGASMAVERRRGAIQGSEMPAEFLMLDASRAGSVVQVRDADVWSRVASELVAARPQLAAVELPGRPHQVGVRISAFEDVIKDSLGNPLEAAFDARLTLVVIDGASMLHRVDLDRIEPDGETHRLVGELTAVADGDVVLEPRYPMSIVAFEIRTLVPGSPSRTVTIEVTGVDVTDVSGQWLDVPFDHDAWDGELTSVDGLFMRPRLRSVERDAAGVVRLVLETGIAFDPVPTTFGLRPAGSVVPDSLPVVVTAAWLAESIREVGDEARFETLRIRDREALIAAVVPTFATVDPLEAHAVVADLPTVQAMSLEIGVSLSEANEYWLATDDDADLAGILARSPFESFTILELEQRAVALRSDPVARGTIGAFSIGFVASAVFAALGFAVAASVSARERLTEFALMRALGLSARQLGAWLAVEQSVLAVLSLVGGAAVGLVLTSTILPLISLTQSGREVVPAVQVVYPWMTIALLVVGLIVILAIVVVAMTLLLRRLGLGSLLRLGDGP